MFQCDKWEEELSDIDKRLRELKSRYEGEKRDANGKEIREIKTLLDRADELDILLEDTTIDPDLQERINATRLAPREVKNMERKKKTGPFESFGDQLGAIIRAETPGGTVDPRLHEVRAASGLSTGVAADGGFLLQTEYSNQLIKAAFDTGLLAKETTKFQIGDNKNSISLPAIDETSRALGSRWGGIQLYHVDEAGLKTKSKPKFRRLELNLNKLVGLCYVTDELLQDVSALGTYISQGFQDEFAYMMDNIILRGTGAGQGLGVLASGSLVTQDKEVGQAAATLNWDNIRRCWSRLLPKCRANAVFCVGIDVEQELWNLSMAIGTGGSAIFQPATGASGGMYNTLMGRPVLPMEQCSALGTLGDIILMDPSWIVMADKAMTTDYSIHLRFLYDEGIFRSKQAAHRSDFVMNSSLKRGNLSVIDIRQSRASKDSDNAEQGQESWASVETIHELPLAA